MSIDDVKKEILSKLNLESEFQSFGIRMIGNPSPKGWVRCPSPFKPEKNPSCGVNIDGSSSYGGYLRIFNASGPQHAIGFFDLAAELGPCSGKDFIDILKFYAEKTGVAFDYEPSKKKDPAVAPKGEIVATYDYVDADGNLRYQVCRLNPKSFRQRRPNNGTAGAWIWNMDGVSALPYRIRNVIDNQTVYIVEGEKCADDLSEKLGLPSTTFHGGAGKFWPEVLPYFKGKNLILIPDNDAPGGDHMRRLAGEFQKTAVSVKIIELPGLEPKGDISNWISSGGTKDQFLDLCNKGLPFDVGEDPVDELNKIHAVIMIGSKVRILYETEDVSGKPDIQFLTEYDFKVLYANRKVPNPLAGQKGQPKFIQLSEAWLKSPKRREYKGIIFEPQVNNPHFYNLFKGFAYEPVQGDWSLFRAHIYENICSKNIRNFDWLISWMARIVQQPGGKKPGTAVVLRGERGTGKGVFAETFGKIFGNHFTQITNSKQVTGRFNSHLKDCILSFLDEAWFAGDKSSEGVLKGLITSDRHMVELKGKDAFMVSNHVNCIIASNSDWVVPVGNRERRFFMLDVSDEHIQNHKYFDAISKEMNESGGIEAMLYDLLNLDISAQNLREAPKTTGLFTQLLQNFNSFEQFWFEKLISNDDLGDFDSETSEENVISKSKLYDQYIDFCKKINLKYIFTPAVFGKNLSKYCEFDVIQRTGMDQKRFRCYVFPEKSTCRKKFSEQAGMEIDWRSSQVKNIKNEIDKI